MRKGNIIKSTFIKLIFIVFLFPFHAFSQDISGVWTGYIYNDTTHKNIQYELAINEPDGKSGGFSHTTFVVDSIKNIGVKTVKIKMKDDHIFIVDDKFIYNNYSEPPRDVVKMYSSLVFSANDSADVLTGEWRTNATKIYNALTGTVFLEKKRKEKPLESIIVAKLIELGFRDKLSFLSTANPKEMVAINNKQNIPERNIPPVVASAKENEKLIQKKKAESTKEEPSVAVVEKKPNQVVTVEDTKKQNDGKQIINNATNKPQGNIPATITSAKINEALKPQKKNESLVTKEKNQNPTVIKENVKKESVVSPAINDKVNLPEKNVAPTVVSTAVNQQIKAKEKPTPVKKEEPLIVIKKEQKDTIVIKEKAKNENDFNSTAQPEKKEFPVLIAAADLSKRKIETIRTVEISQDSLVFSLYDNGTVDGDTVSVLLNGKVIMPRVGLLESAINKTIYLTPEMGDSISVIMYAENLGSIPPNTGLLVIREAKRIYEIRFSGDLDKNSKIILIRKKKE